MPCSGFGNSDLQASVIATQIRHSRVVSLPRGPHSLCIIVENNQIECVQENMNIKQRSIAAGTVAEAQSAATDI